MTVKVVEMAAIMQPSSTHNSSYNMRCHHSFVLEINLIAITLSAAIITNDKLLT